MIVDREVEQHVSSALASLAPSIPVIDEEAAHETPELLGLLQRDEAVWVLDPIDRTKNFAAGSEAFGIMRACVAGGHARASWIVMPARRETFVAEAGGGAFRNGVRVTADARVAPDPP